MAIKEEERQEFAETKVDNGIPSTDVNVRTGMTNDQFDLYQKREVNQEQEFRDDLYYAIKHGDTEKVKELTGWTRDANRPDFSPVSEMTKETQENANKKFEDEEEEKRKRLLAEQNARDTGAEGDKPVDPLLAFMKDPFGLHSDAPRAPETYSGDSIEEAIRRGDWSAAARIMNAMRAREENEKQDFSGDGYVAGSGPVSSGYSAADYGPGFTEDSYGNWDYDDQYGGHYSNFGYTAADGSFTGNGGMKVSADGNITLANGETYETSQPMTQDQKVGMAAADGDVAKALANVALDSPPPSPDALRTANPPGSAQATVPNPDPQKTATIAESVEHTAENALGTTYNRIKDAQLREAITLARVEVYQALQKKYDDPKYADMTRQQKADQIKQDLAVLDGKGTKEQRTAMYTEILGDRYTKNADLFNSVDYGKMDEGKRARLKGLHATKPPEDAAPAPTATNAQPSPDASGTIADAVTATVDGTATAVTAATAATAATTAADPYAWAEKNWYFGDTADQDGYGYADEYGNYWEPDGGYYDEWGYNDKNGGYTYDDTPENGSLAGGYVDKKGNYVDKAGNLYLAGNNTDTPDRLAADAGAASWRDQLQKAAADGTTFTAPAATSSSTIQIPGMGSGTQPVSLDNFSSFMNSTTSFLTTSEASKEIGLATGSNFFDMSRPITGSSNIWGTKFFDPATPLVTAPAANSDVAMTIAPTNPYYKAPAAGAGASV